MTRSTKPPPAKAPKLGRRGPKSGKSLIAAMQASPHRGLDLEAGRTAMPVREVSL